MALLLCGVALGIVLALIVASGLGAIRLCSRLSQREERARANRAWLEAAILEEEPCA